MHFYISNGLPTNICPRQDDEKVPAQQYSSKNNTLPNSGRKQNGKNDREKFIIRLRTEAKFRQEFLTEEQENALMKNASDDELARADEAALQQAIKASLEIFPSSDAQKNPSEAKQPIGQDENEVNAIEKPTMRSTATSTEERPFLTEEQKKALMKNASDNGLERADNAALQQAIKASLEISPPFDAQENRQIFEIIKQASDTYYGIALQDSPCQAEPGIAQAKDETKTFNAEPMLRTEMSAEKHAETMFEMAEANKMLAEFLDQKGLATAHNDGNNHNCCIISLLQLAQRNFDARSHADLANALKQELVRKFPDEVRQETATLEVTSRSPAFRYLVNRINEIFNVDMDVYAVHSTHTGCPVLTEPLDRNPTGKNPVVLWNKGNHYEAIIKKPTSEG